MTKKEIHFLGFLANVDSSIQNVKFEHGFKIEARDIQETVDFIAELEHGSNLQTFRKFHSDYCCVDPNNSGGRKIYLLTNTFQADLEIDSEGIPINFPSEFNKFENDLLDGYLEPTVRLMRLYKEGNICLPASYYFFYDEHGKSIFLGSSSTSLIVSHGVFSLNESDIVELQDFLRNTQIPFPKSFLKLAFDNFENSYQIQNECLSFLSLMVSLEILFNEGQQGSTYKISRGVAVLIGRKQGSSMEIYKDMKKLYGKRSKFLHEGKVNIIEEDLTKLRNYVREAIKEGLKINKDKMDLFNFLNSLGFQQEVIS